MPPRAMWTGQLRLSLVSFGVRMYAATESSKRVAMNQLHKDCHQRVRNQLHCPVHGAVNREDIVKGYAYEKDTYVVIGQEDLEAIRLQSTKTIDLVQFVDADEIDPLYFNSPYFIGPDGPVAEEAFRVIREAMRRTGKVGIGKLVLQGREHIVALSVNGKGFLMTTLRYASEVRSGEDIFRDIADGKVDKEQLTLAESIMKSKAKAFDPTKFRDQYQEAFFEIVKAKLEGEKPIFVEDEDAAVAFNFMDALKESVAKVQKTGQKKTAKTKTKKKPPAKSVQAKKKRSRKTG